MWFIWAVAFALCLRRYDLQLKPVKGLPNISLSMIPGVQEFLDVVLKNILRQYIVFPHSVDVPIVTEQGPDGKKMAMGVTELGKLRVVVERARHLPDADWGFMGMGKSDPYVRLGVGMQVYASLTLSYALTLTSMS